MGEECTDRGSKHSPRFCTIAADPQGPRWIRGNPMAIWPDFWEGCVGFPVCMYYPLDFSI